MIRKTVLVVALVALLGGWAQSATAGPVYNPCAGDGCDGQTLAVWWVNADVPNLNYTIGISFDTSGYKGRADGVAGDYAKDINFFFGLGQLQLTSLTVLSAPGGAGNWAISSHRLDGTGCDAQADLRGGCATVESSVGISFDVGDILTWEISFHASEALPSLVHLKYRYVDSSGEKTSGLLSEDIPVGPVVPEPASLVLLGTGLIGLAARARRRQKK